PSDYPEFAQFLVEKGISSISLNPDTVLQTTHTILEAESSLPIEAVRTFKAPDISTALGGSKVVGKLSKVVAD
ncbi:MAG: hypothetical protein ACREA9_09335, partial [Pyrinomonadaceae bacterium]